MRIIKHRKIKEILFYNRIAGVKRNSIRNNLKNLAATIKVAYRGFTKNRTSLHKVKQLVMSSSDADILHSTYTNKTKPLKEIRDKIFMQLVENIKCPYCDVGNGKKTIDHFLPMEKFPELSVLSKNLVPCCSDCNSSKGTISHLESGEKEFFNPYFDKEISQKYLFCDIAPLSNTQLYRANYKLIRPLVVSPGDFKVIENHYRNLTLLDLYNEISIAQIRDLVNQLKELKKDGFVDLELTSIITNKLKTYHREYGENHYMTVLLGEFNRKFSIFNI